MSRHKPVGASDYGRKLCEVLNLGSGRVSNIEVSFKPDEVLCVVITRLLDGQEAEALIDLLASTPYAIEQNRKDK